MAVEKVSNEAPRKETNEACPIHQQVVQWLITDHIRP